ncbi:predicted protein [Nematostella vectensis]|uniref:C2H2-type domain-containing protein n=1 Tax=Nematostella vectensis TaxID=45351 RepID=A7T145_NEMVE|nr:juxtaposed with another zinc finger protein 1 [Nematostella vectensis]EDO30319.1 predicted protein [Nematostella vectensis]|eukprot:XP_001622419.1 predicted protein [Nematostella vectensis]
MAAFYRYSCLWHGCGKNCTSLLDLIDHIELVHIEKDPRKLEQQESSQPTAIPLSYINSFFTEAARRAQKNEQALPSSDLTPTITEHFLKRKKSSPPTLAFPVIGKSESFEITEEDGNMSDNSDDSLSSTDHSFPSDLIMKAVPMDEGEGKRYVCPMPGCGKRYKNVNGIKYHAKNGHRNEHRPKKQHKCHCGKSYKTQNGLRHHMTNHHAATTFPAELS